VFSYPSGRHEVVERFLTTLADRVAASRPAPEPLAAWETHVPAVARKTLNRPRPEPAVTMGVRALGERITLDLWEEWPGQSRKRIWSGGCQWPDWQTLRQQLHNISRQSTAELTKASAIGAELREVMPRELLRHLDGLPAQRVVALALSPETEVLPWEWLIVEGAPLCLRNAVVRRPVAISDKARGFRFVGTPLRALIVGDAGRGDEGRSSVKLPGASKEANAVADMLREHNAGNLVTVIEREDAVYSRLIHEVQTGDYDVIHFAGCVEVEEAESVLFLWDGRVSSSELVSLLNRRPPALLMLNSDNSAFVLGGMAPAEVVDTPDRSLPGLSLPISLPGIDRPLPPTGGFMGLASRSGVDAFVGCFGRMLDDLAEKFAHRFYQELIKGHTFATALHQARRSTTTFKDITGLFYAGSGCPHLQLAEPLGTR